MDKIFRPNSLALYVLAVFAIVVVLLSWNSLSDNSDYAKKVGRITKSEQLILELQRTLNELSNAAKSLNLPDEGNRHNFESTILIKDLTASFKTEPQSNLKINSKEWDLSPESTSVSVAELKLLQPLFEDLSGLKKLKLKIVSGQFSNNEQLFTTHLAISGVGGLESKNFISFDGHADADWKKSKGNQWKINRWELHDLHTHEDHEQAPFFVLANDACLPVKTVRQRAEHSLHDEFISTMLQTGSISPPGKKSEAGFSFESAFACPSVSVVDINEDGWDDFYLMARWGENQLFINQQDGTFKEKAANYGLNIVNNCTSAAFADFDNDGDKDLMLGRSYSRSQYFENTGATFRDVSKTCGVTLPAMATSVAAVDYNRDGLLDVYITTYGSEKLLKKYLPPAQQKIFRKKHRDSHPVLNAAGAPNVLLVNLGGGKFKVAPESPQLQGWKMSLCSAWADFDQDGDPDVYVSNDFGPDVLMRNDYPNGFVDVTTKEGHETMAGFGMGATWGDYDLDGKQDLYISNMYSKAGLRIGGQIEGIDPRFKEFNNGNRLYRQKEKQFELTSGLKPPKHLVAKVGWSWGGQFADFNNDGFLDIYVPTGYFTAPNAVGRGDDL